MSGYDHMNKPGHSRGLGAHTRVTKIESYLEEVNRPRVIEYGRPREVDELLTKILNEVNGPSTRTTIDHESGTNWGRYVPHVQVETIREYGAQPRYGSSEYGVPSYQRARPLGHVYDDYPDNQWGKTSYPDYDHPSHRDYYHVPFKTESQKYDAPPYKGWGSPTKKAQPLGNYSVPYRQWNRSSSPKSYYDKQSHTKLENPKEYGANPKNKWENPPMEGHTPSPKEYGATKNKWGNPPMNSHKSRDNGEPEYPRDRPSNLVYDHPHNNRAPLKSRDYGTPSNGPYYDDPKGDSYNYPVSKATGYYDDQYRSNPYIHDHHNQPEKDHKMTNWMKPSRYNNTDHSTSTPLGRVTNDIGEALGQLTIAAGAASPEGTAGPRAGFSSPAHQGPREEARRDSTPIDSRKGAKGYVGHNVPLRPYQDYN